MTDATKPCNDPPATSGMTAGGVPIGAKTSEYYRTKDIPARFNEPGKTYMPGNPVFSNMLEIPLKPGREEDDIFKGYGTKPMHPIYCTSNQSYGSRSPSVHTMPTIFTGKSQQFTGHLGPCGMFRNHSLNCSLDKSAVPDH